MEVLNQPELHLLHAGDSLKTLEVTALAGAIMPPHHTTKEAVIIVHQGRALLKMPTTVHVLQKGMALTIPALAQHSLEVKEDFKAVVIMALDSDIEFG